jgi:hypothetical protein
MNMAITPVGAVVSNRDGYLHTFYSVTGNWTLHLLESRGTLAAYGILDD